MSTMRPIRTLATALLVASLAVAGCGRSQPDQSASPPSQEPAVTAPPATKAPAPVGDTTKPPVVLVDGRHPVYLKAVDPSRRTIRFDLIQFYTGDDAIREAAKDGQQEVDNGYYIRNVNPRLRTLPVRADAPITVIPLVWDEVPNASGRNVPVSLAKLATLLRSHPFSPPFWITVRHDQVVKITEQYVP